MKMRYAWVLMVLLISITSCSVMKSHYGRGYSINWRSSKSLKKANHLQQSELLATEAPMIIDLSDVTEQRFIAENSQQALPHATDWIEVTIAPNKIVHPADSRKKREVVKTLTSFYNEPIQVNKVKIIADNGDAPEDKWLLILLAFFIPPLSVYLLDEKDTEGVILATILTIVGCGIAGVVYAIVKVVKKYQDF